MSEQRGSTATPDRGRSPEPARPGLFGRIALFFRQVAAEMRKVVWPTRSELITYTTVVVVFVLVFSLIVLGFDLGMAKLAKFLFGG
ncbi:MAG: preprotein translocase subunit SecE [Actinomycetes bacterium]